MRLCKILSMTRFLFVPLVSVFSSFVFSQTRELSSLPADTLATVGTRAITARDLIERIELMPWAGKDKPTQDGQRQDQGAAEPCR